jgi:hypothetical protein
MNSTLQGKQPSCSAGQRGRCLFVLFSSAAPGTSYDNLFTMASASAAACLQVFIDLLTDVDVDVCHE